MKNAVLIFISILVCVIVNAQSEIIKEVFRLLPAEKVYDLSVATRDSILEGKTYYPSDNDSNEIAAYNYGTSEYVKDYMYVSLSFETGQRATGMIEIRSFKMMDGDNLILVSQSGGVWQVTYNQDSISAFTYSKGKKLIPYKKELLAATNESVFMKPGIPDSVKKNIFQNSNMIFDLSEEKLMLSLNSFYISNDKTMRKWLKGDLAYFDWIKDRFVINKLGFQY